MYVNIWSLHPQILIGLHKLVGGFFFFAHALFSF